MMNRPFPPFDRRTMALLLLAVLLSPGGTLGQEPLKTKIKDRRDVLPKAVADSLDQDKIFGAITRGGRRIPICVLVNPLLLEEDEARLRALIGSWGGLPNRSRLPDSMIESLIKRRGEGRAIYSCLKENAKEFLYAFFRDDYRPETRLLELVRRQANEGNDYILLACFDAECWAEAVDGKAGLAVLLSLRLYRLVIDRESKSDPLPIKNMELLFRDQAHGRAGLPPDIGTANVDDAWAAQVQDAFQAATIAAIDGKIALALFKNTRMMEANWVTGAHREVVNPSLSEEESR